MAGASPAMTIIAIAEGFGRPHPEEGAQRPPRRMGAAALFLLAMFHHARAVHVLLGVAPSVLLELAGLFVARADRLRARGAHPFAALGEARRRQRRDGNAQYKGHQRFSESGRVLLLYLSHANQAPHRRATRFYESRPPEPISRES